MDFWNITFDLISSYLQAEGLIDDKLKVAYEDDFQDVTDVQDKIKKLQKHQAFEAEILANTDQIDKIKEVRVSKLVKYSVIVFDSLSL